MIIKSLNSLTCKNPQKHNTRAQCQIIDNIFLVRHEETAQLISRKANTYSVVKLTEEAIHEAFTGESAININLNIKYIKAV